MHQIETLEFPLQTSQFVESHQRTDGKFLWIQSVFRRQVHSLMSDPVDFCRSQRSQWCAQVRHLQATITCRQQDRGSRRTGFGGGKTGVRCLYFPCGGLWLLWSLCHTTISNSSNSNAEGGEWETESSYFGIRVRKKDRLAGREKETESNGRGKSLCASFVLKKKSIPEREQQRGVWASAGRAAAVASMLDVSITALNIKSITWFWRGGLLK